MAKLSIIYIVGAGDFGRSIAREIGDNALLGDVAAFLDDDGQKIGTLIDSIPVLGPVRACAGIVDRGHNAEALIALPNASHEELEIVYEALRAAEFSRIRILPSVSQVFTGKAHIIQAREIDPQDLLGREPVHIDLKESLSYVRGKRVLVTGAGGSIGSELSRQLLYGGAQRLYLFGHGENSIWGIERELRRLQDAGIGEKATIVPVVGELQDADYMEFIVQRLKAVVVFHCAAHKHVAMMERNPVEAIKNNVFGTRNLVVAARKANVGRFVLVSTDKAVDPSSIYGVSKRLAELIVLSGRDEGLDYRVVRFGNVLGSRGSILPVFKQQIMAGGPVTVTDPEASRWFMTIPEAVSLVLKTAGLSANGGLYFLDMGAQVRIVDLARQLIRFYGYEEESIPITFVGMQKGEKKTEKLYSGGESPRESGHPRIFRVEFPGEVARVLDEILGKLEAVVYYRGEQPMIYRNRRELRMIIRRWFPGVVEYENEPEY